MVPLLAVATQLFGVLLSLLGAQAGVETRLVLAGLAMDRPPLVEHAIEADETLETVATLYGTTVPTLQALNPSTPVTPGNVVAVPAPGPAPEVLPCGDLLAPVDKDHSLPDDCRPGATAILPDDVSYLEEQEMEPRAKAAMLEMLGAIEDATGETVLVRSSYRDYQEQVRTFQYWVNTVGLERALATSAKPGHSEHQLGTTADLTSAAVGFELDQAFGQTAAGMWLVDHAWEYGFVVSYPDGTEDVTGYDYEPWHVRWIGDEATLEHASGMTLHEWLLEQWKPGRYLLPNP